MESKIKSIKKIKVQREDDDDYTAFDIILKEEMNGIGSASIPAKTKKEAIEKLAEMTGYAQEEEDGGEN